MKQKDDKLGDESSYSIFLVWMLAMIGVVSLLFGNPIFSMIGLIVVIMCLGVLAMIAKRRQNISKEKRDRKEVKD